MVLSPTKTAIGVAIAMASTATAKILFVFIDGSLFRLKLFLSGLLPVTGDGAQSVRAEGIRTISAPA
jgi:hypothetical protein